VQDPESITGHGVFAHQHSSAKPKRAFAEAKKSARGVYAPVLKFNFSSQIQLLHAKL